jgi:hypothetical protein
VPSATCRRARSSATSPARRRPSGSPGAGEVRGGRPRLPLVGWRCERKFKKVAKIAADAIEAAEANPLPSEDEDPGLYMGDVMALGLMYRELSDGSSWQTDTSECGRRLRDIASVLETWRNLGARLDEQFPDDAERWTRVKGEKERDILAAIGWLVAGKTMDEIRRDWT